MNLTDNWHVEWIECPECKQRQHAKVYKSLWYIYIHKCVKCEYLIMESEWNEVK